METTFKVDAKFVYATTVLVIVLALAIIATPNEKLEILQKTIAPITRHI